MNKILFLSYDGILDPIGKSQILPYLKNIASNRSVWVISFEKKLNYKQNLYILKNLEKENIFCFPLIFNSKLKKFSKLLDFFKLFIFSIYLTYSKKIIIIHGRGLIPSYIGYLVKKFFNIKLIFDMRGLWADERIDNGSIKLSNKIDNFIYNCLKKIEKKIIASADHLVILTNKILPHIIELYNIDNNKITIIPCCADYNFFYKRNNQHTQDLIKKYNINKDTLVLNYTGSLGGVYQLEEILYVFQKISLIFENSILIIMTPQIDILKEKLRDKKYLQIKNNIKFDYIDRSLIPVYLSIVDIMLSFIKPTFARRASSPTKIFESFAMNIPILCNQGVGDIDTIVNELKIGISIDLNKENNFLEIINTLRLYRKDSRIRNVTKNIYGLHIANSKYDLIYSKLEVDDIIK